ncbi:MAG: hypothetical protein JW881_05990 [Spirochaetales bacterium]|nr:hypothetical protein [Spirochaetales bacterium]
MTSTIYLTCINGSESYIPVKAETPDSVRFKILPFDYEPDDRSELYEFKPDDIIYVKETHFKDNKKGLLAVAFVDDESPLNLNQFLFRVLKGKIPVNKENKQLFSHFIDKLNQDKINGIWYYPVIFDWFKEISNDQI